MTKTLDLFKQNLLNPRKTNNSDLKKKRQTILKVENKLKFYFLNHFVHYTNILTLKIFDSLTCFIKKVVCLIFC